MRRLVPAGFLAAVVWIGAVVEAGELPVPLTPANFEQLFRQIKPQPGESRFWDIAWMLDLHEARKRAAAEGKPLLIWSGAGGPPIGYC